MRSKPKEIDGIIKWIRAYTVWAFVYLDTNPGEAKGLFQYLNHILNGDKRFLWNVVYRYDKEVRMGMEKDPLHHIGPVNLCKWQTVTSYVKQKSTLQKPVSYRPRDSTKPFRRDNFQSVVKSKPRITCHDFNRGECKCPKCKYAHACEKCGGLHHGAHQCRSNPNVFSDHATHK